MSFMKKKPKKYRNPLVLPAKTRKSAGPMKNKKKSQKWDSNKEDI